MSQTNFIPEAFEPEEEMQSVTIIVRDNTGKGLAFTLEKSEVALSIEYASTFGIRTAFLSLQAKAKYEDFAQEKLPACDHGDQTLFVEGWKCNKCGYTAKKEETDAV